MGIITGGKIIPGAVERFRSRALGSPAVGATTAVHAALAVLASGGPQVVTTGITSPDIPRNLTATAGGTAADVAAVQVTVTGTDYAGNTITETLPAFTLNTTGTVTGNKAFRTVTSYSVPAMDGTGATVAIGTGAKLGLPTAMGTDRLTNASFNGVRETTRPTVTVSSSELASNTATLNSTLNGSAVVVDY